LALPLVDEKAFREFDAADKEEALFENADIS